jgi:hypothetical protein
MRRCRNVGSTAAGRITPFGSSQIKEKRSGSAGLDGGRCVRVAPDRGGSPLPCDFLEVHSMDD